MRAKFLTALALAAWTALQEQGLGQALNAFAANQPISNKSKSDYNLSLRQSTDKIFIGTGDTTAFNATNTIIVAPVETDSTPMIITDSYANKGGSSITTANIAHFFPADTTKASDNAAPQAGSDNSTNLSNQIKELSKVVVFLDVVPTEPTELTINRPILSSDFSASATTTLSIGSESASPSFVSSFQNQVLNRFLTR